MVQDSSSPPEKKKRATTPGERNRRKPISFRHSPHFGKFEFGCVPIDATVTAASLLGDCCFCNEIARFRGR
jgi:hypothetical protein